MPHTVWYLLRVSFRVGAFFICQAIVYAGRARRGPTCFAKAVRENLDSAEKVKACFGKALSAMEARPLHDVLKPATTKGSPSLLHIAAVVEIIANTADELVVDSMAVFKEVADACALLSVDIVEQAMQSAGGGLKGGTSGAPCYAGFAIDPHDVAVQGVLEFAKKTLLALDHEAMERTLTSLVKAHPYTAQPRVPSARKQSTRSWVKLCSTIGGCAEFSMSPRTLGLHEVQC